MANDPAILELTTERQMGESVVEGPPQRTPLSS